MSKRAEAKLRKLRKTAYHEAGHAVAAVLLGAKLKSVTVKQGDTHEGRTTVQPIPYPKSQKGREQWVNRECLIRFAGPVAERRVSTRWNWAGAISDNMTVGTIGRESLGLDLKESTEFREYFLKLAESWVDMPENWRSIEAVAEALMERETLTGAEVKELVLIAS